MPIHNDLKEFRLAVTGGTSGLGLALVRSLVGRGARVAFVARTAKAVEQIANETGAYGIVGDIGLPAQPVDATLYSRWKDGVYSVISEESRLSVSSQAHLNKWCVSSTNGHVKPWELKSQQKDLMQVLRRPVETTGARRTLTRSHYKLWVASGASMRS